MLENMRRRGRVEQNPAAERSRRAGDRTPQPNVAANVKRARQQQGLSLETLARLSGVSRAMLGQIETGKSVPTITVIWKVATALTVPVASLITCDGHVPFTVVRSDALKTVSSNNGMFLLRPFAAPDVIQPFDFSEMILEPGHREEFPPLPIGGRATLLVTSGSLEFGDGVERAAHLDAGDSILFQADIEHWIANNSALPTTAYLVSGTRRGGSGGSPPPHRG
jgi:transcriptional regulator with XRE-family HTH domain